MQRNNLIVFIVVVASMLGGFMYYQSQQADVTIELPDVDIN